MCLWLPVCVQISRTELYVFTNACCYTSTLTCKYKHSHCLPHHHHQHHHWVYGWKSLQECLVSGPSKDTCCGSWQKRVWLWDLLEQIWEGVHQFARSPASTILLARLPGKVSMFFVFFPWSSHVDSPALYLERSPQTKQTFWWGYPGWFIFVFCGPCLGALAPGGGVTGRGLEWAKVAIANTGNASSKAAEKNDIGRKRRRMRKRRRPMRYQTRLYPLPTPIFGTDQAQKVGALDESGGGEGRGNIGTVISRNASDSWEWAWELWLRGWSILVISWNDLNPFAQKRPLSSLPGRGPMTHRDSMIERRSSWLSD